LTRKEREDRLREQAQHRAELESELRERERERRAIEEQREEAVQQRLSKLRTDHEAKKRLVSEITRAKKFELPEPGWTADDFLEESEEKPVEVIEGLHYRGNNTLLVAEFKTGKTTLEINLAQSLVDGTPFLGKYKTYLPYGKVAFLNYEMDEKQFRSWLNEHEIENTDRIVPLNLRGYRLSFWDDAVMNELAQWLFENEVGFIIMDPAARAWRGLIENEGDNIQLSEFFGAIDELKRLGDVSNLLIAAHTPREEGATRARGGGEIEAWPDGNWYLSKVRGGKVRTLRAEGRDIDLEETALEFDPDTRSLTATGSVASTKLEAGVEAVVGAVKRYKKFGSTKELADALKGQTGEKRKWIKEALDRGLIEVKQNGQHKVYGLVKS
jgi:hypothetical protein